MMHSLVTVAAAADLALMQSPRQRYCARAVTSISYIKITQLLQDYRCHYRLHVDSTNYLFIACSITIQITCAVKSYSKCMPCDMKSPRIIWIYKHALCRCERAQDTAYNHKGHMSTRFYAYA